MENIKKEKLEFIDYFRGFAILYIVAGHSLTWGEYLGNIYNLNCYIYTGGTFLFLFIAGYLFQYLSYKFDYKTYLKKKFLNVILPSWFIILPGAISLTFFCNDANNYLFDKNPLVKFLNPFLWGQIVNGPLWYISMITIVFILSPILIKLFKNKTLWYSFLISGIVYTITCYRYSIGFDPTLFANTNVSLIQWNLKWLSLHLKLVLYFLPTYMLGMTICDLIGKNFSLIKENSKKLCKIFSLSWFFCYFILVCALKLDVPHSSISRIILTFAVLFLFICFEENIKSIDILHKSLKFLAEYSFGIFFLHKYFLNLLYHHSLNELYTKVWYHKFACDSLEAFFTSFGYFVFAIFGSIIVLYLIKKGLSKIGVKNTRMFIGV